MKLPEIGDTITSEMAIGLCLHYGFTDIAQRIGTHPESFREWVFDGASMVPDRLASELLKLPNLT